MNVHDGSCSKMPTRPQKLSDLQPGTVFRFNGMVFMVLSQRNTSGAVPDNIPVVCLGRGGSHAIGHVEFFVDDTLGTSYIVAPDATLYLGLSR